MQTEEKVILLCDIIENNWIKFKQIKNNTLEANKYLINFKIAFEALKRIDLSQCTMELKEAVNDLKLRILLRLAESQLTTCYWK